MELEKAQQFIFDKLQNQLPEYLYYHSVYHTQDVLLAAIRIAAEENVKDEDAILLRTAALYHDSGFIVQAKDHEEIGCDIARETLPEFNYTNKQIDRVCDMIMATKIPQSPHSLPEEIICDADLDYLGREDFWVISNNLYKELNNFNQLNETEWYKFQIDFFEQHHYFTSSVKKLRNPKKEEHLRAMKQLFVQLTAH